MATRPLTSELLFDEWSEVGIEWIGNIRLPAGMIRWETMLSNGPRGLTKEERQTKDNNGAKMFTGRLSYRRVWETGYFDLGFSYVPSFSYDDDETMQMSFWGLDFRWKTTRFDAQAEYLRQTADYTLYPEEARFNDVTSWGYYGMVGVTVLGQKKGVHLLQVNARLDEIHSEPLGKLQRSFSLGFSYSPVAHVVLRGDYQWFHETQGAQRPNNGFILEAVVDF